ncbi:MAG: hypothetical protein U9Q12_04205 [Patescibacteria group bacterium]|nr:hypothetical protein [Patescibacteria group bacterium]
MKLFVVIGFLMIAGIAIFGYVKKTEIYERYQNNNKNFTQSAEIPEQYKTDNENFQQSIVLLYKAMDLTDYEELEPELKKEKNEEFFAISEEGIALGKRVSDEYLDYMHPEIQNMFKNKLIIGSEIYASGRKMSEVGNENNNTGYIVGGMQKQVDGQQLIAQWSLWLEENSTEIKNSFLKDFMSKRS